jgi:hypothetical protein
MKKATRFKIPDLGLGAKYRSGCPACGRKHAREPGEVCPQYFSGVQRLSVPKQRRSLPGQQQLFSDFDGRGK